MKIIEKRKQEEGEEINEEDLEKEFDAEEMQKKVAHKCDSSIDNRSCEPIQYKILSN